MKTKVLITGGNGYVATSLKNSLTDRFDVTCISRLDFDLVDSSAVNNWFENKTFDVVIHTAASGGSRLKPDGHAVRDQNLKMYGNLFNNKNKFGRLIHFGSGAEKFLENTFYGRSKKEIAKAIEETDNFYNIRIFGVFDENELETRFIRANLIRYIQKEPIVIHTNKIMDFFYMKDLISLVEYYISTSNPEKEVNCSYEQKYTLKNIADIINCLGDHKVPIKIENPKNLEFYCGESNLPPINTFGLESGIQLTFEKLFMMRK